MVQQARICSSDHNISCMQKKTRSVCDLMGTDLDVEWLAIEVHTAIDALPVDLRCACYSRLSRLLCRGLFGRCFRSSSGHIRDVVVGDKAVFCQLVSLRNGACEAAAAATRDQLCAVRWLNEHVPAGQ
jgi:hypothetical protein